MESPIIGDFQQALYLPASSAPRIGTLVPANLRSAVDYALAKLQERVGNLDEYVANRLNKTVPQLHECFAAEQVDALAFAIENIEKGKGFILGDQTGIGKGRVAAGVLLYAKLQGKIPVFITDNTKLYGDIIRDLRDIKVENFTPFPTDSNLSIPLPDGRFLEARPETQKQKMEAMIRTRQLLPGFDAIFTTYSQLQTVKGKHQLRHNLLFSIAPNAILIMDESHKAGGDLDPKKQTSRGQLARDLITRSAAVFWLSATFAKNSSLMTLYSKTDMALAVEGDMEKLIDAIEYGGVPLQQSLSLTLTKAGQYLRRERSYEGIDFIPVVREIDIKAAEAISSVLRRILEFDTHKDYVVRHLDSNLKNSGSALVLDRSVGEPGVSSTNFTSIMHNLIDQMLLALKADGAIEESINSIKEGKKVVIALSNTMGSAISRYVEENGLSNGDNIDITFGDLLQHYLHRSREILVKDYTGRINRRYLTDTELGSAAHLYQEISKFIANLNFSRIPVSPIDYIKFKLSNADIKVGEITGRRDTVNYSTNKYELRSTAETSKKAAVETVAKFNNGEIDVVIINQPGFTGISLHASANFRDKKPRRMIVAQASRNIDEFMQCLGRIHRTGQVVLPSFVLLLGDIPSEKRPAGLLLKKLSSLNANCLASRKGGVDFKGLSDLFNHYGDVVASELIYNNPELNANLGYPLNFSDGFSIIPNAINKVTGRIPLLPIQEQEEIYNLLESEYTELLERQDSIGENVLEAKTLDLDARVLNTLEIIPADRNCSSPFTEAVVLETVDVKTVRKPLSLEKVISALSKELDLSKDNTSIEDIKIAGRDRALQMQAALERAYDTYKATNPEKPHNDGSMEVMQRVLIDFPIGETVQLIVPGDRIFYGVVANIWQHQKTGNPAAMSKWKIRFLVADPVKSLILSVSSINKDNSFFKTQVIRKTRDSFNTQIFDLFDECQTDNREVRQILTGNVLRAFNKFPGQPIVYTDSESKVTYGLLLPRYFDINAHLRKQPFKMPSVDTALKFLVEIGELWTEDKLLSLERNPYYKEEFILQTPKAKNKGGKYFLDGNLLKLTGQPFFSVGNYMKCRVNIFQMPSILEYLLLQTKQALVTFKQKNEAQLLVSG